MGNKRKLCIVQGNCQGETLVNLLSASPEFEAAHEVQYFVNFTRQAIPQEKLAQCELFLHQHLGREWGELSSSHLRGQIPPEGMSLCFPNMLFKGYWPFWTNTPGFDYSDGLLDQLLDRGLGKAEIMHLALRGNLEGMFDLSGMLGETFAVERSKEESSDIKYVDLIEEDFRKEKMFQSVNHPGKRLMLHVVDSILGFLGLDDLPPDFKSACPEIYSGFELPINPLVAAFHGLAFAGQGTRFNVFGHPMTYAEYIGLYLDCKLAGRKDFTHYLHGR